MRGIVLMALLTQLNAAALADWEKVTSGVNSTGYIDRNSIRRLIDGSSADLPANGPATNTLRAVGSSATMSVLIDYQKRPFDGNNLPYLSLVMRNEYHCDERRFRVLAITSHAQHMGGGAQLYTTDEASEWESIAATSIQKPLWEVACGKKLTAAAADRGNTPKPNNNKPGNKNSAENKK